MYKNTKYNENSLDDSSNDKVLGKLDPEILFPTQLKSYYASAESKTGLKARPS